MLLKSKNIKDTFVEVCCLSDVFHVSPREFQMRPQKCPELFQIIFASVIKSQRSQYKHILYIKLSLIKSHLCHPCQLQDIWAESNQISWTKKEQLLSNTVFLWDGWQNLHRYKIMSSSIFTCWALHQQSLCAVNVDPQTVCEQGIWEP